MSIELNKWVKKHILHDFWRQLVALALALVTWTGLRMMLMTHKNISLKVRIEYDRARYFVSSDHLENAVNIKVNAVGGNAVEDGIDDVTNYDLYVTLDPPSSDQKSMVFTLNDIKTKKLPRGVTLSQMTPVSFTVPFDTIISKVVRVKEPPEIPLGYKKLTFERLTDQKVLLRGPSQYIHDITELSLDLTKLDRDKLLEEKSSSLFLDVQNPYPTLERRLNIEPSIIEVNVKLEDVVRDKERKLQCPMGFWGCPDDMVVEAPKQAIIIVNLRGNREIVEKLDEKAILAFVNLEGVKEPGKQEYPVNVGGIPTAIHYELVPATMTVELVKKPQAAEAPPQPKNAVETGGQNK